MNHTSLRLCALTYFSTKDISCAQRQCGFHSSASVYGISK